MGLTSVLLFFVYTLGFGFTLSKLIKVKEAENFLERQLMRTGIGVAAVIITALLLNIVGIPLDWKIFFVLAVVYPAFYLVRNFKTLEPKLRITKSDINIFLVILIFLGSLYMYASGAFAYPYLENDDPWSHASGVKYIAEEKTLSQSPYRAFQYMNPYPPSYDFILALMHQTDSSLQWTIKFFNALIISLSLVYFYFFAKEFFGKNKALFATAVLAAIPAYLSHFIWAPALAMMMFFPVLYALEMIKHDRKWKWIAGIAAGGLLVSHPTHAIILFGMIAIYLLVKIIAEKNFVSYGIAGVTGLVTSLSWWGGSGKAFFRQTSGGHANIGTPVAEGAGLLTRIIDAIPKFFNPLSGTATRPYTFNDFFVAKGQNLINNPTGIGVVVSLLFAIGLIAVPILSIRRLSLTNKLIISGVILVILIFVALFNTGSVLGLIAIYAALMIVLLFLTKAWKEKQAFFIALIWFLFTFLIVNNQTFNLPVGLFAFRAWMIVAIPIALIAAEGLWSLFAVLPALGLDKKIIPAVKITIAVLLLVGIWFSSAEQKYEVNTALWPPGAFWTSQDELSAYLWLTTLPDNTKVFSFRSDDQILGLDKFSCGWCEAEAKYRQTGFNESAQEISTWLKANDYEYLIIGGMEIQVFGENRTVNKINELSNSGFFGLGYETFSQGSPGGAVIFEVI